MSAPPRLLSVRLQGFKSFAERTQVEFGAGISAVVGPNGSGKSNLADALRWALGEQGRALRTRKSEDVIWAGSERRPALGMADVQIVLDNADALLPVEFGLVELGRRLYRSGENEYLLNRQRVRLRDLVDLLDAAHLAENAFLFIGQGMVDQALALRPEERRPLFEEVAGVRRHERRRRRAEEQLVESEANLARVEDIVGELRPQVRRLAAQAQQQASRRDAGDELAEALLVSTHARWHAAAARVVETQKALETAGRAVDAAMASLTERETAAAGISERLSQRAAEANDARRTLDAARDRLTIERLAAAQQASEVAGLQRDRERLAAERTGLERDVVEQRRLTAVVSPAIDAELESELAKADAAVREAERELAAVQASAAATDAQVAAAQRAEAARAAEAELARRRAADLERQLAEASSRLEAATEALSAADEIAIAADTALAGAAADELRARDEEQAARAALATAEGEARGTANLASELGARVAAARGRSESARATLDGLDAGAFPSRARANGGRRVDAELIVEPSLRAAVAAALGSRAGAYVVARAQIPDLLPETVERGTAVVLEAIRATDPADGAVHPSRPGAERTLLDAVRARGGGHLADAIRRDGTGAVAMLLARTAWVPALADALELQALLPGAWSIVTHDGVAVVTETTVAVGADAGLLELRAEAERLEAELARLAADAETARQEASDRTGEAQSARAATEAARARHLAAVEDRRRREADARAALSRAETLGREAAWERSQVDRLSQAVERACLELAAFPIAPQETGPESGAGEAGTPADTAASAGRDARSATALADLRRRVVDLRERRDRVAAEHVRQSTARADAERARTRAESAITFAERRLAEIASSTVALEARAATTDAERHESEVRLAEARVAVETAAGVHARLLVADADDRSRLGTAEREAAGARETLRSAQERQHAAERNALEARLALEGLREQVLVELASLGALALRHLGLADAMVVPQSDAADLASSPADPDLPALAAALDARAELWVTADPPSDVPPPSRLAALRRRYHELGAANPYALEEHAELATRLDGLERQHDDLAGAIERTRALIAELDELIAGQFRTTFAALETAFDARFQQLFGGGFARLVLTEPGNLTATGIEITARPPGKKPQALAMLSGGERALTAVALLFAMLEIRPVPFCVLDEVDAALDEANVGRFTDALRSLSATTQFIVITHNRGTIETADALYGVTVGDDSVSRVISLRLDEATAIADGITEPRAARTPIIPAGLVEPVPAAG